jgi:two-component system, OmpR family, response regulator BaeR
MNETPVKRMILVAEDEPKLAHILFDFLHAAGYATHWLAGGLSVTSWVRKHAPDLILLDIMLPGRDGLTLCRDIRSFSNVPIIMVTARIEEVDRLLGLDSGADDYLCKPYSPRELMARIRAIFRRLDRAALPPTPDQGFDIDPERLTIRFYGQPLELTATEFRLLSRLAATPGRIYSRERLLDCLHDDSRSVTDRTVDSHIKNIRRKIAQIVPDRELVLSVYGVGYKVEA